jgi:hypothetical protein
LVDRVFAAAEAGAREGTATDYDVEIKIRKEYIPKNVLCMMYFFVTVRQLNRVIHKKRK